MSAVAPPGKEHNIVDFSLLYPVQLLNYYRITGDREFLSQLCNTAEQVVGYFRRFERTDGLLETVNTKWNLVDWPDNMRDNYDFKISIPIGIVCHNTINAYYYGAMQTINEIHAALELDVIYGTAHFCSAYFKEFYNEDTKIFKDTKAGLHSALHSNVLPLFFGMLPEDKAVSVLDWGKAKGLSCSVFLPIFF